MRSLSVTLCLCLAFCSLLARPFAAELQSPEQFLGYRVGADRKIADYDTIQQYFQHLAAVSDRIDYEVVGKTTAGGDMFMAIVSAPENMRQLDRIRGVVRRLSDPRTLDEAAARELASQGKAVVMVTCNIHSTEYASSQMSMELAYRLASGQSEAARALDDVILLLFPSINPDGLNIVARHYRKTVGTDKEGSSPPTLYHPYAGHDNNRDFFMFNLVETRNVVNVAFHEWFPQIWIDEHQMGNSGPRLFLTPRADPLNPNVHPLQWRWQALLGGVMALRLEERGFTGVIDTVNYDGWWQGGTACGMWHNQICILSEMASTQLATPIYVDPSEVKAVEGISSYDIRSNYLHPWRGGWWRPRDIVDYEQALTEALLGAAANYREDLLLNYYQLCRDAVESGKARTPRTILVPRRQNDPVTTARMIEALQIGGVEVHYSTLPITAGNTVYPPDNYIIDLAQPNGRNARDLFQAQQYPDLRKSRDEAPRKPYDVAGWTVPYLMGVEFATLDQAPPASAELLQDAHYPAGSVAAPDKKWYVAPAGPNVNTALINRLQQAGVPVRWAAKPITVGDVPCREGSVVFAAAQTSAALVRQAAADLHLDILATDNLDASQSTRLLRPVRVALYQAGANADEGWTRLLLQNHEFPFVTAKMDDLKDKELKKKYDVIVFPSAASAPSNAANLKTFVERDGGTVVALGEACNFAIDSLGARASNTIKTVTSNEYYCPGSLLRVQVDPTHPIGYGMPADAIAYQTTNLAFATSVPSAGYDRAIVVRYADTGLLRSGYLLGEDLLSRRAAVVDLKQKKGRIVLLGVRVQNRAQTFGTFKLLFNAIHAAGLE